MPLTEISRRRLYQQGLLDHDFSTPGKVVAWLGAVQAQDFLAALWALGLRLRDATESSVEAAIASKTIVRTRPMRGTIHFVPGDDIRWILKLMRPRNRMLIDRYQTIDEETFSKSYRVFETVLQGGKQLTRAELVRALEQAGISAAGQSFTWFVFRAQADALICWGKRRGKQFTFTLLDEWLPPSKMLEHDEALATLARRYFTSHGPATLQDFAWWSGMTVSDAMEGVELAKSDLAQETMGGKQYWLSPSVAGISFSSPSVWFLPNYDEYLVSYKDRSAAMDEESIEYPKGDIAREDVIFSHSIVIDGIVVGHWKRFLKKDEVWIETRLLRPVSGPEREAIAEAAQRYSDFLGKRAVFYRST